MTTQRTITLPADQWEVILEAVECHCDEGPPGEGWKSSRLSAACAALSILLEKPESEPDHPDYFLAWILFACDGKLRPEAQRVLAAHGIAQPEPEGLTDEELLSLMPESMRDDFSYAAKVSSDATGGQAKPGIFRVCLNHSALEYARAVLARRGRPSIEPVPVSERLPKAEDCDAQGNCWLANDSTEPGWILDNSEKCTNWTHWLPHWAMPVATK